VRANPELVTYRRTDQVSWREVAEIKDLNTAKHDKDS